MNLRLNALIELWREEVLASADAADDRHKHPLGRMVFHVTAAFAEMERARSSVSA